MNHEHWFSSINMIISLSIDQYLLYYNSKKCKQGIKLCEEITSNKMHMYTEHR